MEKLEARENYVRARPPAVETIGREKHLARWSTIVSGRWKMDEKKMRKKLFFLPVRRLFRTNVMDNKNDSEPALKIDDTTARVQFYVTDPRQYVWFFLSIPALILIHHCCCYFSSSDFFF